MVGLSYYHKNLITREMLVWRGKRSKIILFDTSALNVILLLKSEIMQHMMRIEGISSFKPLVIATNEKRCRVLSAEWEDLMKFRFLCIVHELRSPLYTSLLICEQSRCKLICLKFEFLFCYFITNGRLVGNKTQILLATYLYEWLSISCQLY